MPRAELSASTRSDSLSGVREKRPSRNSAKTPWAASARSSRFTLSGLAPTHTELCRGVHVSRIEANGGCSFRSIRRIRRRNESTARQLEPVEVCAASADNRSSLGLARARTPAISWRRADYRCGRPPPNGPAMMTSPRCCPCGFATCRDAHRRVRTTTRSGRG